MLRAVLDRAVTANGILRGSKEHEELALRLLQLAEVIPERERLVEALSRSGGARNAGSPAIRLQ
jgi:hypothetical protein